MKTFTQKVLRLLPLIPGGKVTTYREIARAAGNARAFRAAGNACNSNPHAPAVPCHRVLTSSGFVGGYNKGVKHKIRLLENEDIKISKTGFVDLKQYLYRFKK